MSQWTRREDARLLTGQGRYGADLAVPGCPDAAFVRSKVAHGTLRSVDCTAAREVAGVVGAWSAGDLAAAVHAADGMATCRRSRTRWRPQ